MSSTGAIRLLVACSVAGTVASLVKFASSREPDTPLSMTHRGPYNVSLPNPKLDELFMDWMPQRNVVICGCAKCATTSLYRWAYQQHFGKSWVYGDTWPYVQDLYEERWAGAFEHINSSESKRQADIFSNAYSFALIRDPKERLISAWKSKVACDAEKYGTDTHDRFYLTYSKTYPPWPRGFVPQLQKLWGAEENRSCLELDEFVDALMEIRKLGRTDLLDRHFLPQNRVCFQRFPAEQWSDVATITDQAAFDRLGKLFGPVELQMKGDHFSTATVKVHPDINAKLDILTAEEYQMLGPYLQTDRGSAVQAGSVALNEVLFEVRRGHDLLAGE